MNVSLRIISLALAAVVLTTGSVAAQQAELQSLRWPPASVLLDDAFRHLGADTIRIGRAEAEIHVFVDAPDNVVQRLYWIQFEGYPETGSDRYDYSDLPHADTVDGFTFRSDVRYGAYSDAEMRDEHDTRKVVGILRDHGLEVPAPMMRVRMVTLDETRKNELLVIYMEGLIAAGYTEEQLDDGAWPEAASGLRQRAMNGLHLQHDQTE